MYSVETNQLTCQFGEFIAVQDLNLNVQEGSFYGFLGPNGAGKSTTIKMLTGLLKPTSGQVKLLGYDVWKNPKEVKNLIGVVPEDLNLFERLTGFEYLQFVGSMYGLDSKVIKLRSEELLEVMDLASNSSRLIADYSHGMKKKISLAAALIHNPRLLFLDEPFEGIDTVAAQALRLLLKDLLTQKVTIFLTSHILEIVEKLCTDVGIIHHGQLRLSGPISQMMNKLSGQDGKPGTASLEDVFIHLIGQKQTKRLSWIQ